MNLEVLSIVVQLIFLEGILSIDNAAVLGAMVAHLPDDQPVPWPGALVRLQRITGRVLGPQRVAALKVGLLGAYVGRGSMLVLANFVIENPWLKLLGAAYLIKLAAENVGHVREDEHAVVARGVARRSFWEVVVAVELADLAFSLDNVVAAVALSNQLWVVMLGVALGILTMRFAAGIFTRLVLVEPILKPAAYVLVLNIGLELIAEEIFLHSISDLAKFAISAATLILAVAYARIPPLHIFAPILHLASLALGFANVASDVILKPVAVVVRAFLVLIWASVQPILIILTQGGRVDGS